MAAAGWATGALALAAWILPTFLLVALAVRPASRDARASHPLGTAALLGASLAFSIAVGETAFRTYCRLAYRTRVAAAETPWEMLDGARIFGLKRNHHGRAEYLHDRSRATPYRTNSLGLRGAEVGPRTGSLPRVLILGDSYTFGWAVEEYESYPSQAAARLAGVGIPVEIINAGVPGYNTRQELALLAELLPVLRPDVVVLAYVMNDAEPQMTVHPPPDETYRLAPLWSWEAAKEAWNVSLCREGFKLPLRRLEPVSDYLRAYDPGNPKWEGTREALDGMAELTTKQGVPLVVLVLPDFNEDFRRYPDRVIHDRVTAWGAARGVRTVDLLPRVAGQDSRSLRVQGDGHPNAAGHAILAEVLHEELTRILK